MRVRKTVCRGVVDRPAGTVGVGVRMRYDWTDRIYAMKASEKSAIRIARVYKIWSGRVLAGFVQTGTILLATLMWFGWWCWFRFERQRQ